MTLLERFLKYVKIYSQSSETEADKGIQPSTPCQKDFACVLEEELKDLGLKDVQVTPECYLYGFLPSSTGYESLPSVCYLAHMDTVDEVSGKDVKPQVFENYDGKTIILKSGDYLDTASDENLKEAAENRETIITSDGTTLLGADDKAGIAAIMNALQYFHDNENEKHCAIEVIFSPDEETGHGMDHVPLQLLKSKSAYTVDGGHIGELETECFNAFKSDVIFTGIATHTGNARGKMVNALTMASFFVSSLPRHEAPETTDGYEGFYAPMSMEGSIEKAQVSLLLRDFNADAMEERKIVIDALAQTTAVLFGGQAQVIHTRQYLNMKDKLKSHPEVVENLVKAYEKAGVKVNFTPIRGGTDGSRLTEMGIPCPNIFTGGHNYHSRKEWASLNQMQKASEVLINLAREKSSF